MKACIFSLIISFSPSASLSLLSSNTLSSKPYFTFRESSSYLIAPLPLYSSQLFSQVSLRLSRFSSITLPLYHLQSFELIEYDFNELIAVYQEGQTCVANRSCDLGTQCETCLANGNIRPRCTRIKPLIPTSKVFHFPPITCTTAYLYMCVF